MHIAYDVVIAPSNYFQGDAVGNSPEQVGQGDHCLERKLKNKKKRNMKRKRACTVQPFLC
jgi:hypothetical protein